MPYKVIGSQNIFNFRYLTSPKRTICTKNKSTPTRTINSRHNELPLVIKN